MANLNRHTRASQATRGGRPTIAYLAHDASDTAVARRVAMLSAGGARVFVIAFRRSEHPIDELAGCPVVDIGRTHDLQLGKRALTTLSVLVRNRRARASVGECDIVIARNLEMLLLACNWARRGAHPARIIYECLDLHRLVLGATISAMLLRRLERLLLRSCAAICVSSPAYLQNYFWPVQKFKRQALIVENRVLQFHGERHDRARAPEAPPWRIGWFGIIRCQRSLDILCAAADKLDGRLEITIRGRPNLALFRGFDDQIARAKHVRFEGSYHPRDLAQHYGEVHFSWAADFFEEGLNSKWLLPNRLYESLHFGATPIAIAGTMLADWLRHRMAGVILQAPEDLAATLNLLSQSDYATLHARTSEIDDLTIYDEHDCAALVEDLSIGAIEESRFSTTRDTPRHDER